MPISNAYEIERIVIHTVCLIFSEEFQVQLCDITFLSEKQLETIQLI